MPPLSSSYPTRNCLRLVQLATSWIPQGVKFRFKSILRQPLPNIVGFHLNDAKAGRMLIEMENYNAKENRMDEREIDP